MRAPFTAILFALELTHDINVLLPLLVAAMLAHATTVLLLKRSILTEKVARRGFHLTREYATDPLEILFVREVMRTQVVRCYPADATVEALRDTLIREPAQRGQHLYPVVDEREAAQRRDHPQAIARAHRIGGRAARLWAMCCERRSWLIPMNRCGRWSFAWPKPVLRGCR